MTNERKTPDHGPASDERVTGAYRDLATERAPKRLNSAVLRHARKAAQPPYKRSIRWTRPTAWAAVVAICLAVTLQVTQLPTPTDIPASTELLPLDSADEATAKQEQERYRDRQVSKDLPAGRSVGDSVADGPVEPGTRAVESATVAQSPTEAVSEEATPDRQTISSCRMPTCCDVPKTWCDCRPAPTRLVSTRSTIRKNVKLL